MSEFVTRAEFELRMVRMENQIVDTMKVVARLSEDLADFRQEVTERFDDVNEQFSEVRETLERQHLALMSALLQLKPKP